MGWVTVGNRPWLPRTEPCSLSCRPSHSSHAPSPSTKAAFEAAICSSLSKRTAGHDFWQCVCAWSPVPNRSYPKPAAREQVAAAPRLQVELLYRHHGSQSAPDQFLGLSALSGDH